MKEYANGQLIVSDTLALIAVNNSNITLSAKLDTVNKSLGTVNTNLTTLATDLYDPTNSQPALTTVITQLINLLSKYLNSNDIPNKALPYSYTAMYNQLTVTASSNGNMVFYDTGGATNNNWGAGKSFYTLGTLSFYCYVTAASNANIGKHFTDSIIIQVQHQGGIVQEDLANHTYTPPEMNFVYIGASLWIWRFTIPITEAKINSTDNLVIWVYNYLTTSLTIDAYPSGFPL